MATTRIRPLAHPMPSPRNPVGCHIYRVGGHWLVGFGPLTPIREVNQAMAWVARTQRVTACPVRW